MKRGLLVALVVLAGVVVVAGTAAIAIMRGSAPPVLKATVSGTASTAAGELPAATLELSIYPNSSSTVPGPDIGDPATKRVADNQGWPFYWTSTSLELPAHSLVTVTIHQYDSGGQIYNPWLAQPHGVVAGSYTIDGAVADGVKPSNVAHTFTIHQYPEDSQPYFFVSVPVPAQSANAPTDAEGYPTKPIDVTFSFITGAPGEYVWNCEFPCGSGYVEFGGPMSQRGFMSGTVTVV